MFEIAGGGDGVGGDAASADGGGGDEGSVGSEQQDAGADVDGGDDDEEAQASKPRRRRRRMTQQKEKLDLDAVDAEDGRPVGKKKMSPRKAAAIEAQRRVSDKTGVPAESRAVQLSKAEKQFVEQLNEYNKYQEEIKNPIKKMFAKRGERFVRNVNLTYLRDPYAMMGTDKFPTETSYTAFHRMLDVGRVNRVVYRGNETSIRYYLDDTEEVFGTR